MQQFKTLAVLAKDVGLVLGSHMGKLTPACNSGRDADVLFQLLGVRQACGVNMGKRAYTYTKTNTI